jgi:ribosomal protein L11 methyltransferase
MTGKRIWTKISIQIPSEYQDLLVGQLATLGFDGFLQEDQHLICFMGQHRWTSALERRLNVTLERFGREFPAISPGYRRRSIRERNWNAQWEKGVHIIEATDRIIIKPSWKSLPKKHNGKVILHIDPKMSFGTGHHETTRLCLVLLEEYLKPRARVLDFGSGTGIQAIAAVKLGARSAVAVDNDEWEVENARENVRKNRLSQKIEVIAGGPQRIPGQKFDLIVANIDMPTIRLVFQDLRKRLKRESIIILSGLLASDLEEFMDFLSQQGVVPLEIIEENEWTSMALTNAYAPDRD